MNPWAFVAIALGILVIIIGVKGTQHNVTSTLTGKKTGGQTTAPAPGAKIGGAILA